MTIINHINPIVMRKKTCPECNATLPVSANFCDQCGHDFSITATQPVVTQPVAQPVVAQPGAPQPVRPAVPVQYYTPNAGVNTGIVTAVPQALTGNVTRPKGIPATIGNFFTPGSGKMDWKKKIMIKCLLATIVTLAVGVGMLVVEAWPGCLISLALLIYAMATTAASIIVPGEMCDIDEMIREAGEQRVSMVLNQIVNVSLVWEVFWLAAGLVCMMFSWWAVFLAEFLNIIILFGIVAGILGGFD